MYVTISYVFSFVSEWVLIFPGDLYFKVLMINANIWMDSCIYSRKIVEEDYR